MIKCFEHAFLYISHYFAFPVSLQLLTLLHPWMPTRILQKTKVEATLIT